MRLYILPHENNGQTKTLVRATSADSGAGVSDEGAWSVYGHSPGRVAEWLRKN